MKQMDLFSSPELDRILTAPGGEIIESDFEEANSPEELQDSIKNMLAYFTQMVKGGDHKILAEYGLKSMVELKQFTDNLMYVISNVVDLFNAYKG